MFRAAIFVCMMTVVCRADDHESLPDSELGNRVYEGLAEHIENADDFRNKPYGFVAVGETHYISNDRLPEIRPFYAMEIHYPKTNFRYAAYVDVNLPQEGHPKGFRRCSEQVQCDDKILYAAGLTTSPNREWLPPEKGPAPELGQPDRRYKSHFNLKRLFPFAAATGIGSSVLSKRDQLAASHSHILRWQELQSVQEKAGGKLESKWKAPAIPNGFALRLVQDKTIGDMPVEVEYQNLGNTSTHSKLKWEKFEGKVLPDEIESSSVFFSDDSRIVRSIYTKINWLPEAELPKYLDCSGRTLRVKLCQRFELPYSSPGVRAEAWDSEKMLSGTQWD